MADTALTRLTPLPRLAQISFRITATSAPLAAKAVGLQRLPEANQFTAAEGCNVLWLGPDEFLAVGTDEVRRSLETRLRDGIPADQGAVVDVSAGRIGLRLSGPGALDALAGCCSLDLHPKVFPTGSCAGTMIAKAQVVLARIGDGPDFLILARPSFGAYVKAWLLP